MLFLPALFHVIGPEGNSGEWRFWWSTVQGWFGKGRSPSRGTDSSLVRAILICFGACKLGRPTLALPTSDRPHCRKRRMPTTTKSTWLLGHSRLALPRITMARARSKSACPNYTLTTPHGPPTGVPGAHRSGGAAWILHPHRPVDCFYVIQPTLFAIIQRRFLFSMLMHPFFCSAADTRHSISRFPRRDLESALTAHKNQIRVLQLP